MGFTSDTLEVVSAAVTLNQPGNIFTANADDELAVGDVIATVATAAERLLAVDVAAGDGDASAAGAAAVDPQPIRLGAVQIDRTAMVASEL
ncbi:hypothetical protein WDW86_16020 [Bdellovibrionota bacterium FG-2]